MIGIPMNVRRTSRTALNFIIYILIASSATIKVAAQEWSEPVRISGRCGGYIPQIIAIGDSLHAVYEANTNIDKLEYLRSTDAGATWSTPFRLTPYDSSSTWRPIIIGHGSMIICLWRNYYYSGYYYSNICYRISSDNGYTWSSRTNVFSSNVSHINYFAASGSGNIINIIYSQPVGYYCPIYNVRSTDFGQTWSDSSLLLNPLDSDGDCDFVSNGANFYFTWPGTFNDDPNDFYNIYLIKSSDYGETWSDTISLDDSGHHGGFPAIAANQNGHVAVMWDVHNNSVMKLSTDYGNEWSSILPITNTSSAWGNSEITFSQNEIIAAWGDTRFYPHGVQRTIFINKSYDDGQSWNEEYWLDRDSLTYSSDPSLAASKDRIFAIWYDGGPEPFGVTSGLYFSRWPDFPDAIDDEGPSLPQAPSLSAYPNPFNTSTLITYTGANENGTLSIFDIGGRLVRKFSILPESGSIVWNARDGNGNNQSSGIYFARLHDSNRETTLKLLLIK
jgi:hypothetical protein